MEALRWLRRCPQESGALFLYRKQERIPEPVLLAAPPVKVTDEEAETFIQKFNQTLESLDPETIAKAAAESPAEGKEPAAGEQGAQQSCLIPVAQMCSLGNWRPIVIPEVVSTHGS